MPRQITSFRVFVGSPSDVLEERSALEDVVRELNTSWSARGVQIELLSWDTHAVPGLGSDPQDVINRSIGNDYDLLIGIMWTRIGTPTPRASSGTREEFDRALERFRRDPNSVDVMFYFKEAPIAPNELDLDQLAAVRSFRDRLGNEGGLYWRFKSIGDLQSFLRIHLTKRIQRLAETDLGPGPAKSSPVNAAPTLPALTDSQDDEDLGVLDLLELFSDSFDESSASLGRMTADLATLTTQIEQRTKELNEITAAPDNREKFKVAKRVMKRTAEDLGQYVDRTTHETPIFSNAMRGGIKSFGEFVSLTTGSESGARDDAESALAQISQLRTVINRSSEAADGLRSSIASWPKMSSDLIRAQKRTTAALGSIGEEFRTADALLGEVERAMTQWLQDHG